MTRLASITNNHLALTCDRCGHTGMLPVTAAIDVFGREANVHHVAKRSRCSGCKAKGQNTFQILYVGSSGEAMLGAKAKRDLSNKNNDLGKIWPRNKITRFFKGGRI